MKLSCEICGSITASSHLTVIVVSAALILQEFRFGRVLRILLVHIGDNLLPAHTGQLLLERLLPEGKKRAAVVAYTRGAAKLFEIEEGVRGVLSSEPVPTIDVMWYMVYAKGIGRLMWDFHDIERLKPEVARLTAKWAERGLKEPIMKRIREELFALHDPN